MSSVQIATGPTQGPKIDAFSRTEGADTVFMQSVVPVDPATGAALPLAQDATAKAISDLNDTMLYILSAIFEKMPRLDGSDRMIVKLAVNGENEVTSPYAGLCVNSVGNPGTGGAIQRMFEPWNFSDAGCARLYQNIIVS